MAKPDNRDQNKVNFSKQNGQFRDENPLPAELHIIRNHEDLYEENGNKHTRTKLTREELLAGHSSIVENARNGDPRIKSPDELLLRLSKKTAPEPIVIDTDGLLSKAAKPAPQPSQKPLLAEDQEPHFGMPELSSLRQELEHEREQKQIETPKVKPLRKEPIKGPIEEEISDIFL